jgi:hypothetical protein
MIGKYKITEKTEATLQEILTDIVINADYPLIMDEVIEDNGLSACHLVVYSNNTGTLIETKTSIAENGDASIIIM